MQTLEKMKPCRRCGGEAEMKAGYDTLQIVCKTCRHEGKKYFGDYYDEGFMLQTYGSLAIREWNRR